MRRYFKDKHNISSKNFKFRLINLPVHTADIVPLYRAQLGRERAEQREKNKREARHTLQPTHRTPIPQINLASFEDSPLTQSLLLSLAQYCANKQVVDFFNLSKELEPGFKNSRGTESVTIRAAAANLASLKTRLSDANDRAEHYERQCAKNKGRFDALVAMLSSVTITVENSSKAREVLAMAREVGWEFNIEREGKREGENEMEVSSGDESKSSQEEERRFEEDEEVFKQWWIYERPVLREIERSSDKTNYQELVGQIERDNLHV